MVWGFLIGFDSQLWLPSTPPELKKLDNENYQAFFTSIFALNILIVTKCLSDVGEFNVNFCHLRLKNKKHTAKQRKIQILQLPP